MKQYKTGEGRLVPLVAITAYDYTSAKLFDELVDIVLVGDSLGMVIQGSSNTLSVTMDEMVYHTRAVSRALKSAHLVADMPFMSYQVSVKDAIRNAGRLLSEGGAESVKLEGGISVASTIEKLVVSGIPVMGHIGLTPQSVHAFGGYKIQGKTISTGEAILQDALTLEESGVYAVVLEGIPSELAKIITERIKIPPIGIGAGPACDGQILVSQDLLGMNPGFKPKFLRTYSNAFETVQGAINAYDRDVKAGKFPAENESYS